LAVEHLRHCSLDDLLEFLAVRHSQRTNPSFKSFARTSPIRNDTALTADYTALVRGNQGTSVTVRPRQTRHSELYRKLFFPPTAKPLGRTARDQVE
jgi:hypothetical protein